MATLVYRTSGRKVKRKFSLQERVYMALGYNPKQVRNEIRWNELKMQLNNLKNN